MTNSPEPFGTTHEGVPVERVRIAGGGLTASVLSYGATVQDLRLDGVDHPLVLGAPELEPYLDPMTYFGALVGRFANRIARGRFELEGKSYAVPTNWVGRHALHGGTVGTGQMVWTISDIGADSVRLALTLPDGDNGFPGTMAVSVVISLPGDGVLDFDIRAETDRASPCSFAHHGFFNLDGSADITAHELKIDAAAYLPVDKDLIPTGEIAPVNATPFDFREPRAIGRQGVDHNFCLSDRQRPIRPVAVLRAPSSGLSMTIETTEPGLQVYDGAYIPREGLPGLEGRRYGPFAGIALETQSWPDAPNRAGFPSAILRPGQLYHHRARYVFRKEPAD